MSLLKEEFENHQAYGTLISMLSVTVHEKRITLVDMSVEPFRMDIEVDLTGCYHVVAGNEQDFSDGEEVHQGSPATLEGAIELVTRHLGIQVGAAPAGGNVLP